MAPGESERCPSCRRSRDVVRQEAADAKRDPSLLAGFKALRLNLGLDDTLQSTLLDAGTWERVEGEAERRGPFVLGVDLGGSASMSAAAAYWPTTGAFDAFGCFPRDPDLRERGLRDGCGRLYMEMLRRDELILAGGRVADVAGLLGEVVKRWGAPGGDRGRSVAGQGATPTRSTPPGSRGAR